MNLIFKNLYFINNEGNKMKRTLLDDLEKIYVSIPCNSQKYCYDCKNFKPCKTIAKILISLRKFY